MITTLTRSAAVPWALSNSWTACVLGLALALGALTFNPAPAHAGVIGETAEEFSKKVTDDPVAQKEIGEAVETLIESAPDAREVAKEGIGVKGGPRQVSGPFQELVVNFDKMACAAWIISFRDTLLGLMLQRDPEAPPQTIQAAQNLLNKVVFACRKVLDPDTNYGVAGGSTTGGGAGGGTGSTGPGVDVIDGELVSTASDWICWNRCSDAWSAWKSAQGMRSRAEQRAREARRHADALERSTIPAAEREAANAQSRLSELEAKQPAYPKHDPAIDNGIGEASAEIARLRTEIAKMKAEAAAKRQEASALDQALAGLRQAEADALKAYLDCLKSCAEQARIGHKPSTFAEATLEKLTPRLQIGSLLPVPYKPEESEETRMARLEAIGQLRTGQANMSGTEVSLALPYGRGRGGQARAEAFRAMELAKSDSFEHHGGYADPVLSDVENIPAGAIEDIAAPEEFVEAQLPLEVQQPAEFYCPDHPGMGPHSH
jgi:hypothetical protein